MRKTLQRSIPVLAGALGVAAASLTVAAPAQAYGDLRWEWASVDTDNCGVVRDGSTLSVDEEYENWCVLYDSADDTWFRKDPGGVAMKAEAYLNGEMVAKVEFHPYGEYLWVYDTKNDGDSVHAELSAFHGGSAGIVSPPGTSREVEYTKMNYDIPEDRWLMLDIYDDSGGSELETVVDGYS